MSEAEKYLRKNVKCVAEKDRWYREDDVIRAMTDFHKEQLEEITDDRYNVTYEGYDERGTISRGITIIASSEEDAMEQARMFDGNRGIYSAIKLKQGKQICYKSNEPCKHGCSGLCKESV